MGWNSVLCLSVAVIMTLMLSSVESRRDTARVRGYCPTGLFVTEVTARSAVLHWDSKGPRRGRGKLVECEVNCAGLRVYTMASGDRALDTDTVTQYVPEGVDHVFLARLQPNFNYSCSVSAESSTGALATSAPYLFSTDYEAPEAPQTPQIEILSNKPGLEIDLFHTSSKYGPISGYEVQFHVVTDKMESDSTGVPAIPAQFLEPEGPIATLSKAQRSPHPLTFRIPYTPYTLPAKITISEDLLNGALKNKVSYAVVTVAYTRRTHLDNLDSRIFLYMSSVPTARFLASGEPVPKHETLSDRPVEATLAVIVGTIVPMVVFLYIAMVGVIIACWEYKIKLARSIGKVTRNPTIRRKVKRMRGRKYARDAVEQKTTTDLELETTEMEDGGTGTINERATSDLNLLESADHGIDTVYLNEQQACSRPKYQPPPEFSHSKPGPSGNSQKRFGYDPSQDILDNKRALTAYFSHSKKPESDSDLSDSDSVQIIDEEPSRTRVVYLPNKRFMAVPALPHWRHEPNEESSIEGIGMTQSRKEKEKAVGKGMKYTSYTPMKGVAVVEIEEDNNEMFRSVQLEEKSEAVALDIDDYLDTNQFRLEAITVVSEIFDKKDEAELIHEEEGATAMEPHPVVIEGARQMVACEALNEVLGLKKTGQELPMLEQTKGDGEEIAIILEDYNEEEEKDAAPIETEALKITQVAEGDTDKEDKRVEFVAEESLSSVDLTDSASELTKNTASLKEAVSSLMFIPRGLSSGPFPLRNVNTQLSFDSSQMSDQAPELEMESDLFGMGVFFQM